VGRRPERFGIASPELGKDFVMKKRIATVVVAAMLVGASFGAAQDGPAMPKPQKEHEWLRQSVGEWESEAELYMEPGKPPVKTKGTESGRMVGGFWLVMESKGDFMGTPFSGIMTLGYDADQKKFVGTWIDSMSHYLRTSRGTLDASGKLTLESEGPCPREPGKLIRSRDTIEIKSPDHVVMSGTIEQGGKWVPSMTIQYRRKK
jgi:hypothetical protein